MRYFDFYFIYFLFMQYYNLLNLLTLFIYRPEPYLDNLIINTADGYIGPGQRGATLNLLSTL